MTGTAVVVGGGISGLTAAYRLRRLLGPAARIVLVEATNRLGGKLHTAELAGQPYDFGAESFLARRPEVPALAAELGLTGMLTHPSPARATIRAGGRICRIPADSVMGVPASVGAVTGVLSAEAVRRVAEEPTLSPVCLDGADVAVGDLVRERFGPEVAVRLVDPLLGGVYAGRSDALGLRATMPTLAASLDQGAGSLLHAAQAVLPAAAAGPVFGAFSIGYGPLIDRLAEYSAAEIRLGVVVRGIRRAPSGWILETGLAGRSETLSADAVVLTVPAPAAAKLLADELPAAGRAFARIELASMAVIGLALPADVVLPDSSGVLIAAGECRSDGTPFTAKAFTFSSRKWPHLDRGHVLVRGSIGRYGEAVVLRRSDDELLAAVRGDLAELTGIRAEPVASAVVRWGGGLPQYGVGHLDLITAIEDAVAAVPGLAVAGAALHGVGVPACIATATAAVDRLADHLRER